jgi:hypothetical protein
MPPKAATTRKKKTDGFTIAFKVDGVNYVVERDQLTSRIELELYQQSHLTFVEAMHALQNAGGSPVPFAIACLIFLARRARGEQVTYDEILDSLSYDMELEVVNEPEPDGPEA